MQRGRRKAFVSRALSSSALAPPRRATISSQSRDESDSCLIAIWNHKRFQRTRSILAHMGAIRGAFIAAVIPIGATAPLLVDEGAVGGKFSFESGVMAFSRRGPRKRADLDGRGVG